MRIKLDTSMIRFMITKPAEPKMDRDKGLQKIDKTTGALLWQLQVMTGRHRRGDPDRHAGR